MMDRIKAWYNVEKAKIRGCGSCDHEAWLQSPYLAEAPDYQWCRFYSMEIKDELTAAHFCIAYREDTELGEKDE